MVYISFCLLLIVCCRIPATQAAEYIEVTASGNRQLKMAVVPPQPSGSVVRPELANEAADATAFDLAMSGVVTTERRSAAPQPGALGLSTIDFVPWLSAGFDLLILGEYELRGEDLTLEFRLFDVVSKKLLTVKRYLGRKRSCAALPMLSAMRCCRL